MPLFLGQSSTDVAGVFRLGKHLASSGPLGGWLLVVHVSHPLHRAAFLIPVTSLGLCDFEQVDETVSSLSVVCV